MAYSYEHSPSNPDAIPLYNDSIFKFWNWFDDVWSCSDWVTWHKSVLKKYGIDDANEKFLYHWNSLALASTAVDCRSFDTAFRNYTKSVGLYDSLFSGIGVIAKPIGAATDVVTNVTRGISSASKVFRITLPLIMIVVVVLGVIYITKYSKKLSK